MPPAAATFQEILRGLVLRLLLILGGVCGAGLRARLARMSAGHRHRARLERELAKAERYRAMLEDPDFWADPRAAGALAQVARVRADAGRRAWVRRVRWPVPLRRMGVFGLVMGLDDWAGRCMGGVVAALRVDCTAAPLTPTLVCFAAQAPRWGERELCWALEGDGGGGLPAAMGCVRWSFAVRGGWGKPVAPLEKMRCM